MADFWNRQISQLREVYPFASLRAGSELVEGLARNDIPLFRSVFPTEVSYQANEVEETGLALDRGAE